MRAVMLAALLLFASDGNLVGPPGGSGNAGAKGPDGDPQPPGVGVDCGGNGLRVVSDGQGTRLACASSGSHHLEVLAADPSSLQNATVFATGDVDRAAVIAANPNGIGLSAKPRADLSVAAHLPFTDVRTFGDCTTGGLPCNFFTTVQCPTGYRAIGGGCDPYKPTNALRRALLKANGAHYVACDAGLVPQPVPTGFSCTVSVAHPDGTLSSYAVCLKEMP